MADTPEDDTDTDALAAEVAAELDAEAIAREAVTQMDTGTTIGDKILISKRGLGALVAGGLSVGALATLGVDEATAQQAAGQVGTSSEPVDVFATGNNVELDGDVTSTSVSGGFEITIDGDTYQFNK
jgi:hypothetical protein